MEDYRRLRAETDIHKLYVSIITGRCGSTYFAHLCEKAGFGNGEEMFNEYELEDLKAIGAPDQFAAFLRRAFNAGRQSSQIYFQVDPNRLDAIARLLPSTHLPFPGVNKYSVMMRRNILAQAISYHHAQTTGIWHSNRAADETAMPEAAVSAEAILDWITQIHTMEKRIVSIFGGFLPKVIFYEDLVASPAETLISFFHDQGHVISAEAVGRIVAEQGGPRKVPRENHAAHYAAMIRAYPWLEAVLQERAQGQIPSATLERMLGADETIGPSQDRHAKLP